MEIDRPTSHAPRHPKYDAIHRALLTGLLSNVGTKSDTHEYFGARGVRFSIFPGSGLFGAKQKWVMAGELVETTKLYGRTCAGVQPAWIERAAGHLVERSYSEPRWDARTVSAIVTEKVTLYGLVLVAARVVPLGPINARAARELFIHHALVLGDVGEGGVGAGLLAAGFFRHNAGLVEEVRLLEAKIRQRNLLADVATRFAFYDAKVPLGITNGAQFEAWRRRAEQAEPGGARLLFMNKADLLRADAPEITPENYPDRLGDSSGGLELPLVYRYEPGEVWDGLTLTVPVAALGQLRPQRYEWLVPGMLEEKVGALIKALPGQMRRNFVPVPEWSRSAAAALSEKHGDASDESLREALAGYLEKQTGAGIRPEDFAEEGLPEFLRMAFRVVDDSGKVLGVSRDLAVLQKKLAREAAGSLATIYSREFNRDHVTAWDFGDLPEHVTVLRFKMKIVAYPALVEAGETCALRLLPAREAAEEAHRAGVRRLFRMGHRREVKEMARRLPEFGRMALQYYTLGRSAELREDLTTLVVDQALFADAPVPRGKAAYEAVAAKGAARLTEAAELVAGIVGGVGGVGGILQEYHALTLAMEDAREKVVGVALSDVREQMLYLLRGRFLVGTRWERLVHFPRYLKGMRVRLEKLMAGRVAEYERDLAGMEAVSLWWNKYVERAAAHEAAGMRDGELELFRWMVEEFRVATFAQELGTVVQVSSRRLEKQWEKSKA